MKLTFAEQNLRQQALNVSQEYRRLEGLLLEVLQQIDQSKLFKKLGFSSLFQYAVGELKLTESVAYGFITVARKSLEIAPLKDAILSQKLSVAKASRMTSALTVQNATHLLAFAQTHSTREVEFKIAKFQPQATLRERAKPISENTIELRLNVTKEVFADLKRAEALLGQSGDLSLANTLKIVLSQYLERKDPVRKAQRILSKRQLRTFRVKPNGLQNRKATAQHDLKNHGRRPLKSLEKHQVFARDQGQCTFIEAGGERCTHQKWLELHHIQPVSRGGSNDPHNLTTLCSYHHDLIHQLSLPIDGQVSWLRSRSVSYERQSYEIRRGSSQ